MTTDLASQTCLLAPASPSPTICSILTPTSAEVEPTQVTCPTSTMSRSHLIIMFIRKGIQMALGFCLAPENTRHNMDWLYLIFSLMWRWSSLAVTMAWAVRLTYSAVWCGLRMCW